MEDLVRAAVSNAALVAVLAAVVLIVDRLVRRPALSHRLWLLLLLKLVTPPMFTISFERNWAGAARSGNVVTVSKPELAVGKVSGASRARVEAAAGAVTVSSPATPTNPEKGRPPIQIPAWRRPFWFEVSTIISIAAVLWLSVAVARGGWFVARLFRVGRRLRAAEPAPDEIQERTRDLATQIGLRQTPGVWLVPATISPMIWTLGRSPRLILPWALWKALDGMKRDALLVHELAHLRRRDHWVRWLELIVSALYWWFPVVTWVRGALHEAEERCCDAWVVAVLPEGKRAYAEALLDAVDFLAEDPSFQGLPLAASGMVSVAEIRDRLALIMAGEIRRSLSTTGLLGVAGLAFVLLPTSLDRPLLGRPSVPRRYIPRVLDTLGEMEDLPRKLNDRGQVLGWFRNPRCSHPLPPHLKDNHFHSYLTRPNQPVNPETDDLNTVCGVWFRAEGLNNLGQVVGILIDSPQGNAYDQARGVVVEAETMIELGTVPDSHFVMRRSELPAESRTKPQRVWATGINDRGQVTGHGAGPLGEIRSFLTGPNQPMSASTIDLQPYDGSRDYRDIEYGQRSRVARLTPFWMIVANPAVNNRGQVIGQYFDLRAATYSQRAAQQIRAFRTAPDRPINPETDDLGFLPVHNGNTWTIPRGINIHGQVVGISGEHAFRTGPNRPINPATDDLGVGEAKGINDHGWTVGSWLRSDEEGVYFGFLDDGSRSYDLNELIAPDSGWVIKAAHDINNHGQIIATGFSNDLGWRGLLLDPVPEYRTVCWLLAGIALTGLAQVARRHGRREGAP